MEKIKNISELETPCVLVDHARLLGNIRKMADLARERGVALRPHVKTHKCVEIARMQMQAGMEGVTVATVEEAACFLRAGMGSVLVAFPMPDADKVGRIVEAAKKQGGEARFLADSLKVAEVLEEAALHGETRLNVLLKIDVGLGRCGIREEDPGLFDVAQRVAGSKSLRLAGIMSHAGHSYGAEGPDKVRDIAWEELAIMGRVGRRLVGAGFDIREISVGATPTVLAAESFDRATEIRPGNYVFLDRTAVRLGVAPMERVALSVLATVASVNDTHAIVDAGSKTLSSDTGAHGSGKGKAWFGVAYPVDEFGAAGMGARVERLSEEHGFVVRDNDFARKLQVGDKVRILPNHACPVANLASRLCVFFPDGRLEKWAVAARR